MIGSSGPMIASTFWKKTIHGAISCDQPTTFDSSSCSRKLPEVWKNFLGMIGARRRTSRERRAAPLASGASAGSIPRSKSVRRSGSSIGATCSPSITPGPARAVGRLERDELHAVAPHTSAVTSA